MKEWHKLKPELFKKRPYYLPGCNSYALSIKHRKRIEEAFGWAKTVVGMAQIVYRGVERVRSRFILTMATNKPGPVATTAGRVTMKNLVAHTRLSNPKAQDRAARPATKRNRSGSATISAHC